MAKKKDEELTRPRGQGEGGYEGCSGGRDGSYEEEGGGTQGDAEAKAKEEAKAAAEAEMAAAKKRDELKAMEAKEGGGQGCSGGRDGGGEK